MNCPYCLTKFEVEEVTATHAPIEPKVDDLTICTCCTNISVYDENLVPIVVDKEQLRIIKIMNFSAYEQVAQLSNHLKRMKFGLDNINHKSRVN